MQLSKILVSAALTLAAIAPVALAQAPTPVRAVVFLDASKSSQHLRPKMKHFVESLAGQLDPGLDKLVIYRLASTVELVSSGPASNNPTLRRNLTAYMNTRAEKGTGLTRVFERAAAEAKLAAGESRIPAIVILSDAADEPGTGSKSLDLKTLPDLTRSLGPKAVVSFNFVTPSDTFTRKLEAMQGAMGATADKRLLFTNAESERGNGSIRRILEAAGR